MDHEKDPFCPMSQSLVHVGEPVIFRGFHFDHVSCHTGTFEVRERLDEFLWRHRGDPFCRMCLARALDVQREGRFRRGGRAGVRRSRLLQRHGARVADCRRVRLTENRKEFVWDRR